MRLCIQHHKPELLATLVDTGLADSLGSSTEFLADCKSQLHAQVPRIAELRRKAAEDPLGFYEGERAGGADVPDDVSVAASSRVTAGGGGASLFTRYTGKNSVGTLGTGGLARHEQEPPPMRRLVDRVEATRPDLDRLVAGLVRRDMVDRARALETLAAEVVDAYLKAVKEVFPGAGNAEKKDAAAGEQQGDGEEGGWRPVGADAVLAETLEAAWRKQEPPVISAFERLSLLS
ncbi:hypothetical protein CIB48_g6946 [Xylaria polymorpha]|nr:hypothetical protein CIB48_g6946 [Xylaria polymorpha]